VVRLRFLSVRFSPNRIHREIRIDETPPARGLIWFASACTGRYSCAAAVVPISGTSTLLGNPPTGFIYRLHRFSTIDPGGVVLSINGVTNDIIDYISAGSGTFLQTVDLNGLIMGPV